MWTNHTREDSGNILRRPKGHEAILRQNHTLDYPFYCFCLYVFIIIIKLFLFIPRSPHGIIKKKKKDLLTVVCLHSDFILYFLYSIDFRIKLCLGTLLKKKNV